MEKEIEQIKNKQIDQLQNDNVFDLINNLEKALQKQRIQNKEIITEFQNQKLQASSNKKEEFDNLNKVGKPQVSKFNSQLENIKNNNNFISEPQQINLNNNNRKISDNILNSPNEEDIVNIGFSNQKDLSKNNSISRSDSQKQQQQQQKQIAQQKEQKSDYQNHYSFSNQRPGTNKLPPKNSENQVIKTKEFSNRPTPKSNSMNQTDFKFYNQSVGDFKNPVIDFTSMTNKNHFISLDNTQSNQQYSKQRSKNINYSHISTQSYDLLEKENQSLLDQIQILKEKNYLYKNKIYGLEKEIQQNDQLVQDVKNQLNQIKEHHFQQNEQNIYNNNNINNYQTNKKNQQQIMATSTPNFFKFKEYQQQYNLKQDPNSIFYTQDNVKTFEDQYENKSDYNSYGQIYNRNGDKKKPYKKS
ncbi:hypothetical protein PPERSA_09310 [Pseudocohnilembus persalinus]|uniref:Uncharacterized protein n=1 Tax=Pseudocohnilembus persalinus TaxID=266149 RepID=A0A0V0R645_PSEPJ|nr:hypothetical protein PPERSA_09310 [Pseudocohnilembus persalinus]|eukprot:KRX09640.1 hypothetical protein PPERSA_09310 [Pseudocohnilembus persalinus]